MNNKINERAALLRPHADEFGNHAIDELLSGRMGRREFLRAASIIGLGVAGGLGHAGRALAQQQPIGKGGTTIRIAHQMPVGAVDPVTAFDPASAGLLNQCGEYLVDADSQNLILRPSLATSWKPNSKGDIWTFRLRDGVRFNDGQLLSAKDVVATFDRLCNPSVGSAARAVLKGVLSQGGTRAVDERTVEFHLDSPHGSFPYYVSSDTIGAVILPANYAGNYERSFAGTGPFRIEHYQPRVGASFVRNASYWGSRALPDRLEFKFYEDQQAQMLALQAGAADVMSKFTVHAGLAITRNPEFRVLGVRSSTHRQIHMHTDAGNFKDKRVRQALALSLDRDAIVRGLLLGRAEIGNDHPFAPMFASSDPSVPTRRRDLAAAKRLLAEADVPNGFKETLTTESFLEIPDLAVVVQNGAKAIGLDITLKVESQELYYGSGKPGKSDWLDSPLGITDYAHRGVPDLFLGGPLTTGGAWNAARFSNSDYDRLARDYVAALDVSSQKRIAGQIERLLQDETPVVIPYFEDSLIVTRAQLKNVAFSPMGQLYLQQATGA
jgi:peptide/nickel transport system substrate-binding protein